MTTNKLKTPLAVNCDDCAVSKVCLPSSLPEEDILRLDKVVQTRKTLAPEQFLFRMNDPLQSLYAVRSGAVKIYAIDSAGQARVLGFFLPGELLGLEAIAHGRHTCYAQALDTTSVCELPYKQLSKLSLEVPALQQQLMRVMSQELLHEYAIAGDYTAEERLSAFLLNISNRYQRRGYSAVEFNLVMSRQEIASYLRLTPETVSRLFKHLQQQSVIEVKRRALKILDIEKLRAKASAVFCG